MKGSEVKMADYLKIYEKFKDLKEVKDYIDDVNLLRYYYTTQQFSQMQDHIHELMDKYPVETLVWNIVNPYQPTTIDQAYYNAENFLQMYGALLIVKAVKNYSQRLSADEVAFIGYMIKKYQNNN